MTENLSTESSDHRNRTNKHILPIVQQTLNLDSALADNSINEVFNVTDLNNVKDLSLCTNRLSCLSENFTLHLNNLARLNLSNNNLNELPNTLSSLRNLEHLSIDDNQIVSLPSVIGELKNLKSLSVSKNKIDKLPENLENLMYLEELDLNSNKISTLPISYGKLNRLKKLILFKNYLSALPKCIVEGMKGLETLDLSYNNEITLQAQPLSNNLKRLFIRENKRSKIFPKWVLTIKFSNLEELVLDGTKFQTFDLPNESAILHLKELSMIHCGLSEKILQEITKNMVELEKLNISNGESNNSGNLFWNIPIQNIKNPHSLKEMNVRATGLSSLLRTINNFCNLTKIDIGCNNISCLPDEICLLDKLEILIIDHNALYTLPENIGEIAALRELKLDRNYLSRLPDSILNLKNLWFLDLYENEFSQVPVIVEKIENLKGLDIDGNYFTTDDLQLRDICYENLRNTMRGHCLVKFEQRHNEPKFEEVEVTDVERKSSLDSLSDAELPCTNDAISTNDTATEENWDISDDSADEFDPMVSKQPRVRCRYSPFTLSTSINNSFCPADLHKTRVRDQVARMYKSTTWKLTFNHEEGQFEDA